LVSERVDLGGLAVTLVDTAGARDTLDVGEREGVTRGVQARAIARVVLLVLDGTEPLTEDDERLLDETAGLRRVVVVNKSDLRTEGGIDFRGIEDIAPDFTSARTGAGVDDLRRALVQALTGEEVLRDPGVISNIRHIALLEQALELLSRARDAAIAGDTPEEFLLADLQAPRGRFDEVVGVRTSEDMLRHIFAKFCIGK